VRIVGFAVLVGGVIGCYSPVPREGAPCDATAHCPAPQRCVLGACSLHDAPEVDAAPPPPPIDAAIDAAPPPDAMRLACVTTGLTCAGGTATTFPCGGNCWVRCTANVSRATARAACVGWQGALGQIDDAIEQDCVAQRTVAQAWIGLIQSDAAAAPGADWTWNGAVPVVYTHWAANKPDDADNTESGEEQCGSIRPDGSWDDDGCTSPTDFFCERP
jgi:hypothetical protein